MCMYIDQIDQDLSIDRSGFLNSRSILISDLVWSKDQYFEWEPLCYLLDMNLFIYLTRNVLLAGGKIK